IVKQSAGGIAGTSTEEVDGCYHCTHTTRRAVMPRRLGRRPPYSGKFPDRGGGTTQLAAESQMCPANADLGGTAGLLGGNRLAAKISGSCGSGGRPLQAAQPPKSG